jgi:hypothetical protein
MPTARSPKTLYEMYGVQVNQSIPGIVAALPRLSTIVAGLLGA